MNKAVRTHVTERVWALLDSAPSGEVEYANMISDLEQNLPPVSVHELIKRGLGTILDPVLQNLRQKEYILSVSKGLWKKDGLATFDEVGKSMNSRTQKGVSAVVNVAKHIRSKAAEMPGLRGEILDDLDAWISLAEEEWLSGESS